MMNKKIIYNVEMKTENEMRKYEVMSKIWKWRINMKIENENDYNEEENERNIIWWKKISKYNENNKTK
jgi:hypothetical protein